MGLKGFFSWPKRECQHWLCCMPPIQSSSIWGPQCPPSDLPFEARKEHSSGRSPISENKAYKCSRNHHSCMRLPTIQMSTSRSICNIIEHKRYIPCTDNTNRFISPEFLLRIDSLGMLIRLPSWWGGFATRSLAGFELCVALYLPTWCVPAHPSPICYKQFLWTSSLSRLYCWSQTRYSLLRPLAGTTGEQPFWMSYSTLPLIREDHGLLSLIGCWVWLLSHKNLKLQSWFLYPVKERDRQSRIHVPQSREEGKIQVPRSRESTANPESDKWKLKNDEWDFYHDALLSTVPKSSISKTTLLEAEKDISAGSQAILQYVSDTWCSWDAGSGLLFWRWPTKHSRASARDGFYVYVVSGKRPSKENNRHWRRMCAFNWPTKLEMFERNTILLPSTEQKAMYINSRFQRGSVP